MEGTQNYRPFIKDVPPRYNKVRKLTDTFFEALSEKEIVTFIRNIETTYINDADSSKLNEPSQAIQLCDGKCYICYENEANALFYDCMHGGVCSECAKEIILTSKLCSLCRRRVGSFMTIEPEEGSTFNVISQSAIINNS